MNKKSGNQRQRPPQNEQVQPSDIPQIKLPTAVQLAQLAAQLGWDDGEHVCSMWALPAAMKLHLQASAYLKKLRTELKAVKSQEEFRRFIEQYQGEDLREVWPPFQEACVEFRQCEKLDSARRYLVRKGVRCKRPDSFRKLFFNWFAAGGKYWRRVQEQKGDLRSPAGMLPAPPLGSDDKNVNDARQKEYFEHFGMRYVCQKYEKDKEGKPIITWEGRQSGEWMRTDTLGKIFWKIPVSYLDSLVEWRKDLDRQKGNRSRHTAMAQGKT